MSKLVLVDSLRAPTAELRAQHRHKTLVVDSSALVDKLHPEDCRTIVAGLSTHPNGDSGTANGVGIGVRVGPRGPGILDPNSERGRVLRDTR